jgi:alkylation response protein AidB-like acyl-CoA dehydrogenase
MVDLTLTDDERVVRDAFAEFFRNECPTSRLREAEKSGFDAALWSAVAGLGVPSMGMPESIGGGGASLVDLALVAKEAGRWLVPVPVVESLVAARALVRAGGPVDLLNRVADGTVLATFAVRPVMAAVATLAPAGAVADLLIALRGDQLVAVRRTGDRPHGVPPANLASAPILDWPVDGTDGEVTLLAEGPEAHAIHAEARSEWEVLTAAALSGVQAEAQRLGLDYVKGRKVFGTLLGQFQAVQHRFADLDAQAVGGDLLVLEAAWARTEEPARFSWLADAAFLLNAQLAFWTARESLQFHGGYGYTLEYDIQMYFRRAKAWPLALGPVRDVYRHLATQLFDGQRSEA